MHRRIRFLCFAALTTSLAVGTAGAIELEQLAGAAHAYPVMLEPDGKALGTGEFSQQIEDGPLRIEIIDKLQNESTSRRKRPFSSARS